MTAQARPAQEPERVMDSRFSFKKCNPESDHGHFYAKTGVANRRPFRTQKGAQEALNKWIDDGQISESERTSLEEGIRSSGLPEEPPYLGPFTFLVEEGVGYLVGKDPEERLTTRDGIRSKQRARTVVQDNIGFGRVLESEREKLLGEVGASALPEEVNEDFEEDKEDLGISGLAKALATLVLGGRRTPSPVGTYSFVAQSVQGGMATGDFIHKDLGPQGHGLESKTEARTELEAGINMGFVDPGDNDRLLQEIEASALPD
ncbi:MAG: hypothetical protein AAB660_02530 [Patescibacteria group bacterium]